MTDETLGTPLLFAYLYKKKPDNYAIIASNLYSAQQIYESLLNFLPEEDVVFFPTDDLLRAEQVSSSKELLAQRLYALGQLESGGPKILVAHTSSLLRYLPDPELFKNTIIKLKKGSQIPLESIKTRLIQLGYHRVQKVDQSLQFALRGDILDVFSVNEINPIRIEFFDDEIESIRVFDVSTQRSKEERNELTILPASDLFLSNEQIISFKERISNISSMDAEGMSSSLKEFYLSNVNNDVDKISERIYQSTLYRYYGFAVAHPYSVLSYFKPKITFVPDKSTFEDNASTLNKEARDFYYELHKQGFLPSHMQHYMSIDEAFAGVNVTYGSKYAEKDDDERFLVRPILMQGSGLSSLIPTINFYLKQDKKVVISLSEAQQRKAITSSLDEVGIEYEDVEGFSLPQGQLGISELPIKVGFEFPALGVSYLSSREIFGLRGSSSRYSARYKNASILKSYDELNKGDYVVHENYGIGRFEEVTTREINGVKRDYLYIAYANDDRLLVPLEQFRLVRKYAGREGAAPRLSSLYGNEWKKRKSKIYDRINELADRLIALYGKRVETPGYAFPKDDDFQERFENEFPHELTPDQHKAIDDIKGDMEKPVIMDRLVIGDVGFGKTELAFRAAFKAISAHKQVAMLCPTTLLARQHYEVAKERFASFGIHLGLLSRLIPEKEQQETINGLKDGGIDMVIGTHRLLSSEIKYKDLGLLVVDEEQRFGVEQKEKIKELKETVDVLTLSATPIPRTLQMSLVGIRKLSQINTPPKNRTPIQTYVTPYRKSVIMEVIGRELSRNGQVFYLKNNINGLHSKAFEIQEAIPQAKIGVVHGQMDKEAIEEVMEKFYLNELNVLVCTSIIENGIDVPNANMIIVENADKFGLSQLYQIKGRVGRGDRIAYAYLTYNSEKRLNEDAQKRLKAIQEFAELGSGYKIAQRDLLIRGAGDLLGPEQAGFIDSVGLDLYLKMLSEAIERKEKGEEEAPVITKKGTFMVSSYIPKEYVDDEDKLEVYQKLDDAKNDDELEEFIKSMRDIYGRLPKEMLPMIEVKKLNIFLEQEEFSSAAEYPNYIDVLLSQSFTSLPGIGLDLFNALTPYLSFVHVSFVNREVHVKVQKEGDWMTSLKEILQIVHELYKKRTAQ